MSSVTTLARARLLCAIAVLPGTLAAPGCRTSEPVGPVHPQMTSWIEPAIGSPFQTSVEGVPEGTSVTVVWGSEPGCSGASEDERRAEFVGAQDGEQPMVLPVSPEVLPGQSFWVQFCPKATDPWKPTTPVQIQVQGPVDGACLMGSVPVPEPVGYPAPSRGDALVVCGEIEGVCPVSDEVSTEWLHENYEAVAGRPIGDEVMLLARCHETTIEPACCYIVGVDNVGRGTGGSGIGRPFRREDGARQAPAVLREGWAVGRAVCTAGLTAEDQRRLADYWAWVAAAEHASIASFGQFSMQLLQLGAPATLLAATAQAMLDEVRHAELAYGLASAFSQQSMGPGVLNTTGSLATDPAEILFSAVQEGCVSETICAVLALEQARAATDPQVREALFTIAEDEMRHAELSWSFVAWMLDERPELRVVVESALTDASLPSFPSMPAGLEAWGALGDLQTQALSADVLRDVIWPCATALLRKRVA